MELMESCGREGVRGANMFGNCSTDRQRLLSLATTGAAAKSSGKGKIEERTLAIANETDEEALIKNFRVLSVSRVVACLSVAGSRVICGKKDVRAGLVSQGVKVWLFLQNH